MTKRPTIPSYQPNPSPEDPFGFRALEEKERRKAAKRGPAGESRPPRGPREPRPPHETGGPGEPGGPGGRKPRRRVFRWIALVLVVAIVGGGVYVAYNYQRFVSGVTHVDAIDGSATDSDGKDENILLVGDDHRPKGATAKELAMLGTTDDGGAVNTDTMIVLHIPADGRKATLISFPRDSWVDIPGFGKNKLNAAFGFGSRDGGGNAGGARLLIKVIQNMTGLSIDHYVRVSLLGFYNVVKALGPVNVCLKNAVDDPWSTTKLPAGVSSLNAKQALSFVRQRHGLPNGDLDRQVRQQYFLSVEASKLLSAGTLLNPVKLGSVLDAVSSSIETDPDLNFLSLAAQLKNLGANNIRSATIPITGTPTIYVNGSAVSIVEVDTKAMPAFINGLVDKPSAYTSAKRSKAANVSVTVLNGSDTNGMAAAAAETLAGIGFTVGEPGSTDATATTTIEYPSGMEGDAKAVARYVSGAAVSETSSVTGVTLVLGADGKTAKAKKTSSGTKSDSSDSASSSTDAKPATGTNYTEETCIN